jgi:4-hydroxybenzoate polyprenyltransferase
MGPSWLSHFFKKARLLEILLMTGFVLIAMPFIDGIPQQELLKKGLILFCANFLLFVGVYAANSYFGFKADQINPRLNQRQFASANHYLAIACGALILSLILWWILNRELPLLAALSFLLWILYSCPGGAKSRPIWGTLVHLFGQILQFHLCILAFTRPTWSSFFVSAFFAFLFSSGHLMHEVTDYEYDALAGIRTNAVTFGLRKVIGFYKYAIPAISLYWILLFGFGFISFKQFVPFFAATVCHALITWFGTKWARLGSARFQNVYRAIYLTAGFFSFLLMEY